MFGVISHMSEGSGFYTIFLKVLFEIFENQRRSAKCDGDEKAGFKFYFSETCNYISPIPTHRPYCRIARM